MRDPAFASSPVLEPLLAAIRDVTLGDVAAVATSALLIALLWWPFAAAAVAGGWSVFVKAGRSGWASLVPVYNALEFLRIARAPGWWLALLFVPAVNVVVYAAVCRRMARAFGQEPRFAAGLFLAPPLFVAILGLGPARYRRFEVLPGQLRGDEGGAALPAALPAPPPRLVALR